jgi:hypothetical protein
MVQAVDPAFLHPLLRELCPTGTAKGCRGAARDMLVVALTGHNTNKTQSKIKVNYPNATLGRKIKNQQYSPTNAHSKI